MGAVTINIYIEYLKAVKSWLIVAVVFILFLSTQVLTSTADYFVSLWYVCYGLNCLLNQSNVCQYLFLTSQ